MAEGRGFARLGFRLCIRGAAIRAVGIEAPFVRIDGSVVVDRTASQGMDQSHEALPTNRVSASFVRAVFRLLRQHGIDGERWLGCSVAELRSPLGFPLAQWVDMLEKVSRRLKDPMVGLRVGQAFSVDDPDVLGNVLSCQPTLRAALQCVGRYQRLVYDQSLMRWIDGGDHVDLCWGREHGHAGRLVGVALVSSLIQCCRQLTGRRIEPLLVHFDYHSTLPLAPYVEVFGCPVAFNAEVTRVRLAMSTLDLPLPGADAELAVATMRQAEFLLSQLPRKVEIVAKTREAVTELLRTGGGVTLVAVAEQVGVQVRTLQRLLRAARTTFHAELDATRRLLAEKYLSDPGLSIADVALLLGYSEHSALTRSFRQWTGLTPRRWRSYVTGRNRQPPELRLPVRSEE